MVEDYNNEFVHKWRKNEIWCASLGTPNQHTSSQSTTAGVLIWGPGRRTELVAHGVVAVLCRGNILY